MYNYFTLLTDSSRKIHIGITPRNKKGAEMFTEYQSSLYVHSQTDNNLWRLTRQNR